MNSLYLDTNQMRSSKQLFLSIWYKEKENQKVQLVCRSSVSWYVPELRLKSKSANSFYGTSTHGELITQRSGGERTSSMNKNCECFSLTLLSQPTHLVLLPLSPCGFCDFGFYSGAHWVSHISLSHPEGTGDGIRDEGERNRGVSRDKLNRRDSFTYIAYEKKWQLQR